MANSISSAGTGRYSHFAHSKRSMELHEPIYLNLWTVAIQANMLPAGLGASQEDVNLILEGVRSISGLQTQPGVGSPVIQQYKGAERGYAGSKLAKTHLDIQMTFELNMRRDGDSMDNYTYKFLRKWHDLIADPLTGRQSIKANYVCPQMIVAMHDKEGLPYWQWTLYNVFPSGALPEPALSYDSGSIWQGFNVSFWCDYYDETIL